MQVRALESCQHHFPQIDRFSYYVLLLGYQLQVIDLLLVGIQVDQVLVLIYL
jgi:hypothetical protein